MQKIFLSASLIIAVLFANAQKDSKPVEDTEEFTTIKMPKFPIANFPKKSVKIAAISLVQLVRDSVQLGYVLKGMDYHVVHIKPAKPLTAFLQEQIEKMYKNDYKEGGAKILWVLKELRVAEKTGMMEYAYIKFSAAAYMASNGYQYKPITSVDTVFVKESSGDVTAWHGESIQEAFKFLLKQTVKVAADQQLTAEEMTVDQIMEHNKPKLDMPVLTTAVYNEGAYANFQEFLDNKPSVLLYQPVTLGKRKVKFIQMKSDNRVDTLNVWGICKNGELYKYEEDYLIPIEKQGNGFIVSNYVKLASRRNKSSLGIMFGLIGVIGDELIKANEEKKQKEKLMLVKSIPYIKNENKQPQASCIDMKTGQLSF
ncbi:hypothetical protein [Ferruginibacter sp.]|nr:hypothetical protein [Ferruginibacter sp.]